MSFRASSFKLSMFEQCGLKYKLTYVDGLGDQYKTPRPYLTMGAHVHNALKDCFEKPPQERNFILLEECLRSRWKENRAGFEGREDEARWGVKALKMLRLFATRQDLKIQPLLLEDYYDTDLTPEITILGRIDRVDADGEDGLHVMDYKTGKSGDEPPDSLQLVLYSFIIQQKLHRPVTKASYLYLAENKWVTIQPTEEDFEKMSERVIAVVQRIASETHFSPNLNAFCSTCDFLSICPKRREIEQRLSHERIQKK